MVKGTLLAEGGSTACMHVCMHAFIYVIGYCGMLCYSSAHPETDFLAHRFAVQPVAGIVSSWKAACIISFISQRIFKFFLSHLLDEKVEVITFKL